jgi:hypothetical protein
MSEDTDVVVRELVSKCRPILERKARRESLITYEDLAREVGPKVNIPELHWRDPRLHRALGDLSTSTYDRDGLLLTVVVVKADIRMPGGGQKGGFYGLAKDLGAYPDNASKEEVFRQELEKVYAHYSRRKHPDVPDRFG